MAGDEFVYRGTLDKTPLPEMLATIHRYGVPGVMEFASEGITKRVFFINGDVIFATSSNRSESLGDYLLREGRITKAQHRVSVDHLNQSPGRRHGSVLVELGFLGAHELGTAVREQVQLILWSLFNWEQGEVAFRVGRFRDDEVYKIKIPTPRAVLSGCKRITDGKKVTSRLGGRTTIFRQVERPDHLALLRLESGEQQMLDMIDGKATLFELCEKGPMTPGLNARVLYAFTELGLVNREASVGSGGIRIHVKNKE